ncbi:hypothetical protein OUZ56_012189 [Daphnia magna]|uniref:Uncharacterized protein n=1 Tax=Daphnia magna TaxID=35525 RepID=A0ABQ9Z2B4_9CRUS|nr:hypothetical protein OUZ56_012189 [Daphnia magna]
MKIAGGILNKILNDEQQLKSISSNDETASQHTSSYLMQQWPTNQSLLLLSWIQRWIPATQTKEDVLKAKQIIEADPNITITISDFYFFASSGYHLVVKCNMLRFGRSHYHLDGKPTI